MKKEELHKIINFRLKLTSFICYNYISEIFIEIPRRFLF
ncbi:hypothetical protein SAMN05421834_11929 [Halanaerobium kushneri]|uniref:Uncharacterized protein n=1 Tax=Halanaerobium kushneri TaxID=56779 RepID=A0A1N6ZS38_9FIRM|nr:hypothetical protein SAMN05421834_11929 [Halanaerobium kushneri]